MVCFIILFDSYFLSHFLEPYHPLKLYHAKLDETLDYNMYLFFFRERDFGADDTTPVSIVDLRERGNRMMKLFMKILCNFSLFVGTCTLSSHSYL